MLFTRINNSSKFPDNSWRIKQFVVPNVGGPHASRWTSENIAYNREGTICNITKSILPFILISQQNSYQNISLFSNISFENF